MNWRYIMLHHSLTKDSQTVSWDAIKKYHIETMGWMDIGYHWGIELIGNLYQIQYGRDENLPGAHCKEGNMNNLALGFCFVGNYDEEEVPYEMWKKALIFIKYLSLIYEIPIPDGIVGHRDYAPYKSCPGKKFNIQRFKEELKLI